MFKHITNTISEKYYTFVPSEFLPVFIDGKLANKREFHIYKIKWIVRNHQQAAHYFTHQAG